MDRCPRQDPNNLKAGDIFEIDCPECGNSIEFFKDETERTCKGCGGRVVNPRLDAENK
ncbi:MAG: hypothetical protein ACO3BO_02415 [Anaerohalosphaeraceae bacterium]|jgi:ribosomal protein S27E